MTRAEAADWLRCSVETVDREIVRHGWKIFLHRRRVLVSREDVEALVKPKERKSNYENS